MRACGEQEPVAQVEQPRRSEFNSTLERTNIRGKDYIEVPQRIQAFWEYFPGYTLTTSVVRLDDESCVFRAEICDECGCVVATGHAEERRSASSINKTSYVENCETSAVGRALGIFGIGSTRSVASADEVQHAIAQQEAQKRPRRAAAPKAAPTEEDGLKAAKGRLWTAVKAYCAATGHDPKKVGEDVKLEQGYAETVAAIDALAVKYDAMAEAFRSRP